MLFHFNLLNNFSAVLMPDSVTMVRTQSGIDRVFYARDSECGSPRGGERAWWRRALRDPRVILTILLDQCMTLEYGCRWCVMDSWSLWPDQAMKSLERIQGRGKAGYDL